MFIIHHPAPIHTISSSENAILREQLDRLTKNYNNNNMLDHRKRLVALEAKSLSNTAAPLAVSAEGHDHLSKKTLEDFIEKLP
jgi:hypothetical protein